MGQRARKGGGRLIVPLPASRLPDLLTVAGRSGQAEGAILIGGTRVEKSVAIPHILSPLSAGSWEGKHSGNLGHELEWGGGC